MWGGGYLVRPISSFVFHKRLGYRFNLDSPTPFYKTEFKVIYNREKRQEKGKSIANNVGNYIGMQFKYSFGKKNSTMDNDKS